MTFLGAGHVSQVATMGLRRTAKHEQEIRLCQWSRRRCACMRITAGAAGPELRAVVECADAGSGPPRAPESVQQGPPPR